MEKTQRNPLLLTRLEANVNSLHQLLIAQLDPLILITRLYDAASKGDLNSLHNLLQQDPLILDRCIFEKSDRFMQSPLHVAASLDHLEFTTEILRLKPELAEQLDQSTRSSALHLASKKGHLDVVKTLIEVNPNMCLSRDQDGWNPVHVAAISNQLHVLDFLVRMNPHAALEKSNAGETLLHLCVKYAHIEPLKYLVNKMGELLNVKDKDGNTVLHLAVLAKQVEVVKLLIRNKKIQQNAINKNGLTAMDCLIEGDKNSKDTEIIRQTLKRAKTLKAKHVEKQRDISDIHGKWLKKQRNTLMVVASLIAAMAFQAGVNPPPQLATYYSNPSPNASPSPSPSPSPDFDGPTDNLYMFIISNTISLVSSLGVVLLLISGLPCKRLFVVVLMISMWVAVTSALFTYFASLVASLLWDDLFGTRIMAVIVGCIWISLVLLLLLGHIFRLLIKSVKKLVRFMKKMWHRWTCRSLNSSTAIPY